MNDDVSMPPTDRENVSIAFSDRRAYVKPAVGKSLPVPEPEPPREYCRRGLCYSHRVITPRPFGVTVQIFGYTRNPICKWLGHSF